MELRKWPRKNDADSIKARQAALDGRIDTEVFEQDLTPWAQAQEALTGVSVVPTAVIGPIPISLGEYELTEPDGALVERGRAGDEVYVPLAHTEGSLSDSLYRGARAAAESGGFRTEVLRDRMTRASAFTCRSAEEAAALGRWIEGELPKMRDWLAARDDEWISRYAKLREVETYVAGPICHVMWAFTTGDACGPNMMTRNAYALNMGYVMEHAPTKPERAILEANMGGDKKPSHRYFERGGHGKTVIAEVTLTEEAVRRVLRTTIDDLLELSWAGTHGAVASGMQSVAFTPATAIAAVFAATGQDLGMVGTSSMAHGTGKRVEGGLNAAIRLPGLEVGTVGGGTTLPYARAWLGLMDCAGPGKVYRFAQIVAAATLALEISASAAMATSGSENFFKAHFERGGLMGSDPGIPPQHDPACFGCGDNPIGFHLPQPETEGADRYETTFTFDERHQGGPGLAHGGLVAALVDEACGLVATWYRFPTVTGRIFLRYRRPVPINTTLSVRAWVEDEKGRRVYVRGELWEAGELLAEARLAFVHVPLEHFLVTPEGRAIGEAWQRRLDSG